MSFETLRDELVPGAMIVTRKDRISKLYCVWSPDDGSKMIIGDEDPRSLYPRTVCTMIGVSERYPNDWFYVIANGTSGWLSYWDIAHVEYIRKPE